MEISEPEVDDSSPSKITPVSVVKADPRKSKFIVSPIEKAEKRLKLDRLDHREKGKYLNRFSAFLTVEK